MQRSVKLHIPIDGAVLETIRQYNEICNRHIGAALENKTVSKNKLHKLLYGEIRSAYPNFPSALIQCARDHAVEMLKANRRRRRSRKNSMSAARFDLRSCKIFLDSGEIQLTTVEGRKRARVIVPNYLRKYATWAVKGCIVGLHRRRYIWVAVVVEAKTPPVISNGKVLGIDLGLKNLLVCSDGTRVKSAHVRCIKRRYAYLRARLQACGTRSAKRHLKNLAGRERRFTTNCNHGLSKAIVEREYSIFALEELKGIRKGNKGRRLNRMRHAWAYSQFRQFLTYKAEALGKQVVPVNPAFTSQRCSRCGFVHRSNRRAGLFYCKECGFSSNADFNASLNISQLGCTLVEQAAVNQPIPEKNEGNAALQPRRISSGSRCL